MGGGMATSFDEMVKPETVESQVDSVQTKEPAVQTEVKPDTVEQQSVQDDTAEEPATQVDAEPAVVTGDVAESPAE